MRQTEQSYLSERLKQETLAALRANDPKSAALHVELANRYAVQLNGFEAPGDRLRIT